jgi:3-isopropylmalate/(R)-2-methylmalate dehydratase small subunit
MLPIVASHAVVDKLFKECEATAEYSLNVDLPSQTVTLPSGETFTFDIHPTSKHNLLNGLDEIGLTLLHAEKIKAFEGKHKAAQPWLFA